MIIGRMDRYITIEQPTYSTDSDIKEKKVTAWTTYKSCWTSWVHQASQEVFETGQMVAKDTYEWKTWYYSAPAIKMDMRISYDSNYYYIVSIKELGRKEAWQITTIRRDN